ncbi:MAG: hypothetical protein ACOY93_10290 [Bacillota bacterium]
MRISKKWMITLGAAVLTAVLATGAAFAATATVEKPLKPSEASPGVQALMGEIRSLREARMQELKAEIEALIDKAAAEGRITADEATRLKEGPKRFGRGHKAPHGRGGMKGFPKGATLDEVKARLDAAVQSGRITREQADQILQKWQNWKAQEPKS